MTLSGLARFRGPGELWNCQENLTGAGLALVYKCKEFNLIKRRAASIKLEMSLWGTEEKMWPKPSERGKACLDHWRWTMGVIMVKFAGMTRTPGDNIWEISWSNNAQNNVKNNNSEPSLRCDYNWRIHAGWWIVGCNRFLSTFIEITRRMSNLILMKFWSLKSSYPILRPFSSIVAESWRWHTSDVSDPSYHVK